MSDFCGIFDGQDVASIANETNSFLPIPAGWYKAMVCEPSDGKPCLRDTAKGGKLLKFMYEIVDGEFKGRKIYQNINIVNANPTAVSIGRRELSALVMACGKPMARDSSEIVGSVVSIRTAIRIDGEKQYNDIKEVTGVRQSAKPVMPAPTPSPAPSAAPAPTATAKAKLPWEK